MFFSSAVVTSRVLFPLCLVALTAMQAEPTQLSSSSVRDRVRAYELSCVATLQAINVANGPYWGGDPAKGYASSLRELGPRGAGNSGFGRCERQEGRLSLSVTTG